MKKGFWEELDSIRKENPDDEYDFSFMDMYSSDTSSLNAYDFLHGCCNEFADYLHSKYGYQIEAIREYGHLIHMYCTAEIDGVEHYIDVRGICDDFDEFMQDFTDNGLWENSDCTIYRQYDEVPKKFKLKKRNKSTVEFFDRTYACYQIA